MISLSEISQNCNTKEGRKDIDKTMIQSLLEQIKQETSNSVHETLRIGLILIKLSIDDPSLDITGVEWMKWLEAASKSNLDSSDNEQEPIQVVMAQIMVFLSEKTLFKDHLANSPFLWNILSDSDYPLSIVFANLTADHSSL